MNNLLDDLNPEQLQAVKHQDGPLLIVAGAGTGKTTVITRRLAYLIEQKLASPEEILVLTFTEKAAGEMAERAETLLPYGCFDLWIATFHGFSERILKQHGLAIGLSTNFKLLNEFEQWALVKKNLDKFGLDYYRPLGNPTKFIHALLKHFSRAKDEDINPREYLEYAGELQENFDAKLSGSNKKGRGNFQFSISNFQTNNKEMAEQEAARLNEVANAYHTYQQLLLDNNALDFGDLINYCLKLFRQRPAILEQYRRQFKYILLDEFQDTNWAQYELIKILAAPKNNLVVVGDDDQCLPGSALILTERGKKRIDKVESGEKVATAVGRGYLSYSRVKKVMKSVKRTRLLTFTTARGSKITVTDNHKMFVYVSPGWQHGSLNVKQFYYVYLMYKQELGWRLGMTSDLTTRLKLERSADYIVALKSFSSQAEARYNETLWSLKYGLPTVCFQERDGIMTKREWNEKLYQDLDVNLAARKLASDLNIDLGAPQVCLAGVNRGGKKRIKINLEMCQRNYRSKYAKGIFLASPKVLHQLTVETSYRPAWQALKNLGFNLVKARGGFRLRITSADLFYLGRIALRIRQAIGGIIENQIKAAAVNVQHKKALIISASNVLPGMFLPVVKNNKIIYEQITRRLEKKRELPVYDLEVESTHNFVADNILVHNSIYKFRGASLSNILQFNKDYPAARRIFLTKNYRSGQNILDLAYEFIKQNNPNRLEWQLKNPKSSRNPAGRNPKQIQNPKFKIQNLNKRLVANNKDVAEIEMIEGRDLAEEVKLAVDKIVELKNRPLSREARSGGGRGGAVSWNDFAILVRANDSAREWQAELERRGLPYIFGAARGLYFKPVIMDVIAYFKLLDNYHESAAVWRLLNLPIYNFSEEELVNFNHLAAKKALSLYEVLNRAGVLQFSAELQGKIKPILALIAKHSALAREKPVSEVFLAFMNDSGYLKYLTKADRSPLPALETPAIPFSEGERRAEQKSRESLGLLNQFLKRLQAFESSAGDFSEKFVTDKSVKAFLAELNLELEAGGEGALAVDLDVGPEAIKILTVHGAKGLEFPYVFITNLVDKRFPTVERSEPINLPDALIKEILPEGDVHLEEERRLFYVAMTRAKSGLYFSWARDYGGRAEKKPSRFLVELGLVGKDPLPTSPARSSRERRMEISRTKNNLNQAPFSRDEKSGGEAGRGGLIPSHFSYSQLAAYSSCPYQYRFAHVLKIPCLGKEQFSFGKTLHATLYKLFNLINEKKGLGQEDLFGNIAPSIKRGEGGLRQADLGETKHSKILSTRLDKGGLVTFEEILELYEQSWVDDWYESKKKKQERKKQGQEILKIFYAKYKDNWPKVLFLEKGFNLKIVLSASPPSASLGAGKGAESYIVRGMIDRVDQTEAGLKLVDYKTGQAKSDLSFEEKEQLLIYQLAAQELFKEKVAALSYYYLDNNSEVEFLGGADDLEKIKTKIISTLEKISRGEFPPQPSRLCAWCDFKGICEYRK
jgi:DNA helicase-2/ATP-dependent DNA helicase PcrA